MPSVSSLKQNFPNPFNPKTIISYELQSTGNVSLKVYNILGNSAVTLVSEKQNAGSYSVEFDGSKYPSGVYFYSLESGDVIQVKRMMLLK